MTPPPAGPPSGPAGPAPEVPTCYRHAGRETWIRCQRCDRPICPDCMREAAVGHQCPTCVREGARSTRQGRAPYGGRRSANPALTSLVLIGVNVAVWLLIAATGGFRSRWYDVLAMVPRGHCGLADDPTRFYPQLAEAGCAAAPDGLWVAGVADGAWWQLVTSAFTHVDVWHIGFNMLALWFLGPQIEAAIGRTRFLALYVLSFLAAGVLVLWASPAYASVMGASGAVFGLIGALLVIVHKVGGDYRGVLMWLGINIVITFTIPNISWQGHVGGLLGGLLVAVAVVHAPRQRRSVVQWGSLGALTVVLALLAVVRTTML